MASKLVRIGGPAYKCITSRSSIFKMADRSTINLYASGGGGRPPFTKSSDVPLGFKRVMYRYPVIWHTTSAAALYFLCTISQPSRVCIYYPCQKKEPFLWCIMWYRRICSLISPRCIDAWRQLQVAIARGSAAESSTLIPRYHKILILCISSMVLFFFLSRVLSSCSCPHLTLSQPGSFWAPKTK